MRAHLLAAFQRGFLPSRARTPSDISHRLLSRGRGPTGRSRPGTQPISIATAEPSLENNRRRTALTAAKTTIGYLHNGRRHLYTPSRCNRPTRSSTSTAMPHFKNHAKKLHVLWPVLYKAISPWSRFVAVANAATISCGTNGPHACHRGGRRNGPSRAKSIYKK